VKSCPEEAIPPACDELGIGFVQSARQGLLTGKIAVETKLDDTDDPLQSSECLVRF
jgi:hypothetical protein